MLKLFNNSSVKIQGMFLYLIGVFAHTVLIILFKKTMNQHKLPIYEIITIRQLIIVLFLIPYMVKAKFDFFNKERFKSNFFRNILFAISTILLYTGTAVIPTNDAVTIQFVIPILASIMAVVILKEKPSNRLCFGLFFCIVGIVLAKKPTLSAVEKYGYLSLLGCVLIRSYLVILSKKISKHSTVMQMLCYTHIIMLLFNLPFFYTFKPISLEALGLIVLLAFSFFAEYFFIYWGYRKCDVSTLQPLDFFKLIFSILISYAVLNEGVTKEQILGGFIVICAYLYSNSGKKKENAK